MCKLLLYLEKQNSAYLEAEKSAAQYAAGSQEHIGTLGNAYISSLLTLKDALSRYGEEANESTKQAVINAANNVLTAKTEYEAAGGQLSNGMITAFQEDIGTYQADMSSITSEINSKVGEFQSVGINLANGIAAGISLGAPTINQAAASAVSGAIQAAKDAGVIRSPSRKMKKEVGLQLSIGTAKGILQGIPNIKTAMSKTISTGISYAEKAAGMAKHVGEIIPAKMAAGMAENEKAATEQFEKMLSVLDHQRAMDLISEAEYYDGLTKLRDDYLSEGTKEYAQQTEKIYSYYKDLAEDQEKLMQEQKETVKDLFSDLADYAADKLDDVQGEIDSFAEKLRGIGGLYDEIDLGGGRKYKRLRNFEEDSAAMESYGEQLTALREKLSRTNMDAGTIKMFFAELRDLDIAEGLDLTRMFNQMSEADFTAYLAGYKKKYDVSQQVAGMLHGDEYADAVQDINEHTSGEIIKFMKEELEAAGAEIPDGFFDVGRQSAENFSGSFLTVFQNMLNEVKSQIDAASASFAPHLAYAVGAPGNYASTVYGDTNYNIYGGNSDDLTAQIQAMETRKRMLGIGG